MTLCNNQAAAFQSGRCGLSFLTGYQIYSFDELRMNRKRPFRKRLIIRYLLTGLFVSLRQYSTAADLQSLIA